MIRRTTLRLLPGFGEQPDPEREEVKRTRLDEEIIEDAATRHEQLTDEADRWQDDRL